MAGCKTCKTRASQSKRQPAPVSPPSPTASDPLPASSPQFFQTSDPSWGPSSIINEQDQIMQAYIALFDEGEDLKDALISARAGAEQAQAGQVMVHPFVSILCLSCLCVLRFGSIFCCIICTPSLLDPEISHTPTSLNGPSISLELPPQTLYQLVVLTLWVLDNDSIYS